MPLLRLYAAENSNTKLPVADKNESHTEEVRIKQALKAVYAWLICLVFLTSVMSNHKPREGKNMICFKSVSKAASFDLTIMAIGQQRFLAIKDNHSVEHIVWEFQETSGNLSLNFVH